MPEPTLGIAVKRLAGRGDGKRGRGSAGRPDSESSWSAAWTAGARRSTHDRRMEQAWRATSAPKARERTEPLDQGAQGQDRGARGGDTMDPYGSAADESGDVRAGARDTTVSRRRVAQRVKILERLVKKTRRGIVAKSLPRLCRPAAGDRGGLPRPRLPARKSRRPRCLRSTSRQSSGALEHATEYLLFYSTVLDLRKTVRGQAQLRTIWSEAPNVHTASMRMKCSSYLVALLREPTAHSVGTMHRRDNWQWRPAKWHCRSESRNSTARARQEERS